MVLNRNHKMAELNTHKLSNRCKLHKGFGKARFWYANTTYTI